MADHTEPCTPEVTGATAAQTAVEEPAARVAAPVEVPGVPQFLGRWRFMLVVGAVWIAAAAAGAGLYYWWYHALDKRIPVFAVLVYVVACIVGSLLTAMVQNRPTVTATALAMMSAPLASVAAAAALYGGYVFGWITR